MNGIKARWSKVREYFCKGASDDKMDAYIMALENASRIIRGTILTYETNDKRSFENNISKRMVMELIDEGLLQGRVTKEWDSAKKEEWIEYAVVSGITYKGRMELARLKKEKREQKWYYRTWTYISNGAVVALTIQLFFEYLLPILLDK